jgi:hypothetical protein
MTETTQEPAQNPDSESLVPPYFAFRTLLNQLDYMKERGVPARIDRSFLVGMSGAGQAQYITGLRSLGLIDANGAVTPQLTEMVTGSIGDRKRVLREALESRYGKAIELGKTNATTGQLVELFREEYGATGDTARKGIAFFLNAARYVGDVPVSPMFQTPKVSSGSGARKRRRPDGDSDGESNNGGTPPAPPPSGTQMSVTVHTALAGVLMQLPPNGPAWSAERRDEFKRTFGMVLDFSYPVDDAGNEDGDDFEDSEEN